MRPVLLTTIPHMHACRHLQAQDRPLQLSGRRVRSSSWLHPGRPAVHYHTICDIVSAYALPHALSERSLYPYNSTASAAATTPLLLLRSLLTQELLVPYTLLYPPVPSCIRPHRLDPVIFCPILALSIICALTCLPPIVILLSPTHMRAHARLALSAARAFPPKRAAPCLSQVRPRKQTEWSSSFYFTSCLRVHRSATLPRPDPPPERCIVGELPRPARGSSKLGLPPPFAPGTWNNLAFVLVCAHSPPPA